MEWTHLECLQSRQDLWDWTLYGVEANWMMGHSLARSSWVCLASQLLLATLSKSDFLWNWKPLNVVKPMELYVNNVWFLPCYSGKFDYGEMNDFVCVCVSQLWHSSVTPSSRPEEKRFYHPKNLCTPSVRAKVYPHRQSHWFLLSDVLLNFIIIFRGDFGHTKELGMKEFL